MTGFVCVGVTNNAYAYSLRDCVVSAVVPFCSVLAATSGRLCGSTENVGLENARPKCRGAKCSTGKCGSKTARVESAGPTWHFLETLYVSELILIIHRGP